MTVCLYQPRLTPARKQFPRRTVPSLYKVYIIERHQWELLYKPQDPDPIGTLAYICLQTPKSYPNSAPTITGCSDSYTHLEAITTSSSPNPSGYFRAHTVTREETERQSACNTHSRNPRYSRAQSRYRFHVDSSPAFASGPRQKVLSLLCRGLILLEISASKHQIQVGDVLGTSASLLR